MARGGWERASLSSERNHLCFWTTSFNTDKKGLSSSFQCIHFKLESVSFSKLAQLDQNWVCLGNCTLTRMWCSIKEAEEKYNEKSSLTLNISCRKHSGTTSSFLQLKQEVKTIQCSSYLITWEAYANSEALLQEVWLTLWVLHGSKISAGSCWRKLRMQEFCLSCTSVVKTCVFLMALLTSSLTKGIVAQNTPAKGLRNDFGYCAWAGVGLSIHLSKVNVYGCKYGWSREKQPNSWKTIILGDQIISI